MAEPIITIGRAAQHEAPVLRLDALLHELRPLALRHPQPPAPAAVQALAEALLYDARPFTPHRRREALPAAAPGAFDCAARHAGAPAPRKHPLG